MVWQLGVLLYQLVCQKQPFLVNSEKQLHLSNGVLQQTKRNIILIRYQKLNEDKAVQALLDRIFCVPLKRIELSRLQEKLTKKKLFPHVKTPETKKLANAELDTEINDFKQIPITINSQNPLI